MFKKCFVILLSLFFIGAMPVELQKTVGFQYVLDPDLQDEYPNEPVCLVKLNQIDDVSVNDGAHTCTSYQIDVASETGGVCTVGGGSGVDQIARNTAQDAFAASEQAFAASEQAAAAAAAASQTATAASHQATDAAAAAAAASHVNIQYPIAKQYLRAGSNCTITTNDSDRTITINCTGGSGGTTSSFLSGFVNVSSNVNNISSSDLGKTILVDSSSYTISYVRMPSSPATNSVIAVVKTTFTGFISVQNSSGRQFDRLEVSNDSGIYQYDGNKWRILSSNKQVIYPIASQAEAEAGTDDNKLMTPLRTKQAIEALEENSFSALIYSFNNGQNAISRWSDLLGEHTVSVLVENVDNIPHKSGDVGLNISGANIALSPKTISKGVNVYTFRLNAADITELETNRQTAKAVDLRLYRGRVTDVISDVQHFPIDSAYTPPSLVVRVDNKAAWVAIGERRNPNTWYYWSGGMARGFVQISGEGIVPPPPDLNYLWDGPITIETSKSASAPFTSGSGVLARIINVSSGGITTSSTPPTGAFFTWFMNRNFSSDNRPFNLTTFTNSVITFGGQESDWTNVRDFSSDIRGDIRIVTRNTAGHIRNFSLKEATRNGKGRYTLPTDKSKYFRPEAIDPVDIAIIDGTNKNFSGL